MLPLLTFEFDISQGVCIGLGEVMGSAGKQQLADYMEKLIATIKRALCDEYVIFNFL